jgi:outer membrane lipoprotein-sorting protein
MKNLLKIRILSVLLIVSLCLLTSCKTAKEGKGNMNVYEAQELFSLVAKNSLDYQTFSGRMKTTLRSGKNSIEITGQLRIIRDEKLQLSFQVPFLGEMYRLTVSNDSLTIIDRRNKLFVAESMQDIRQTASFDFNLYNLQALFSNQLFLVGKPDITTNDFHLFAIHQDRKQALITTKDQSIDYTFTVDNTNHVRNTLMSGNDENTTMNWSYGNFSSLENKLFPMQMGMNLDSSGNKLSANFAFTKIDLNKDVQIDLNVPKNYRRITPAQAINLINSLK